MVIDSKTLISDPNDTPLLHVVDEGTGSTSLAADTPKTVNVNTKKCTSKIEGQIDAKNELSDNNSSDTEGPDSCDELTNLILNSSSKENRRTTSKGWNEEKRIGIVRSKRVGLFDTNNNTNNKNSKYNNFTINERDNDKDSNKPSTNTLTKRKRIIIFLVCLIAIIYLNSTMVSWSEQTVMDKIPVVHHSNVPGMKDDITDIEGKILEKSSSASIAFTYSNVSERIPLHDWNNRTFNASFDIVDSTTINNSIKIIPPPGYLVWSDQCKMPNLDPYDAEVMRHFKRQKYTKCKDTEPLTSIKFDSIKKRYILQMEEHLKKTYTKKGGQLRCCYQAIERTGTGNKADESYNLSECLAFTKSTPVQNSSEFIIVRCHSKTEQTYVNAHYFVPERPEIRERLNSWKKNDKTAPISVLMIGIDSISRQNLIRSMPKTAQNLYDNSWFEMSGYNKIDDNTFPNFLAIFAGLNSTTAYRQCEPKKVGGLDKCPLVWFDFRKHGFVTAYGEDEAWISTFNYLKLGFEKPPVDYYLRPFTMAAEKNLPNKKKSGLKFCLGFNTAAKYIYDYAIEFAKQYKNDPFFGIFWTNTFSHNDISDPSCMDDTILDYFEKLESNGILNRSVVVFFSDHGMRFGPTRELLSGRYEERLPFFFIWLPPWMRRNYPEFVNALRLNKNRLTNNYDAYITLKHILKLSGRADNISLTAKDCSNCQTLLEPVPQSRSCEEIAIEDHWCTCTPFESVYKDSAIVKQAVDFAINYINDFIHTFRNGTYANLCAKLSLNNIKSAYRAIITVQQGAHHNLESYQIVFVTRPGTGIFEATIRHYLQTKTFELTGSISRLNSYASESGCVEDGGAKKYCKCESRKTSSTGGKKG